MSKPRNNWTTHLMAFAKSTGAKNNRDIYQTKIGKQTKNAKKRSCRSRTTFNYFSAHKLDKLDDNVL